jgi:hypothetical protein
LDNSRENVTTTGPSLVPVPTPDAHDPQQGRNLMHDARLLPHPTLAGPALHSGAIDAGCAAPAAPLYDFLEISGVEIPIDTTERFRTLGNLVAFLRGPAPGAAG